MSRIGLSAALIAAGMLHGVAAGETVARTARKEPPPEPAPDPRFIGMDLGSEPGFTVTFSARDQERLTAAEAKRARKAAKLRPTLSPSEAAEPGKKP